MNNKKIAYTRAVILSLIGIFIFFIEIELNETKTIPLDHLVSFFKTNFPTAIGYYTGGICIVGALYPFVTKSWKSSKSKMIFSFLSLFSIPLVLMYFFEFGPEFITNPDTLPYFFKALAIPVSLFIPIGSIFLAFILSYGLLEFIGILFQKLTRPIFKTPGKSAVDLVASFVGSYALGMLITNRLYQEGKYTAKESAIIAMGFSTVSLTFMIVVVNASGLSDYWSVFLISAMIVTFLTTFIVIRIRPISTLPDEYYEGQTGEIEEEVKGNIFKIALQEAGDAALKAPSFNKVIKDNFLAAIKMSFIVVPSILAIGVIGMLIAQYTPLFDIVGLIFYPFFYILNPAEALVAGKAVSMGFVEMFLPVTLLGSVGDISMPVRFIVAITSISQIVFLSGTIPCFMGTVIPMNFKHYILVFVERTIISIILAAILFQIFSLMHIF